MKFCLALMFFSLPFFLLAQKGKKDNKNNILIDIYPSITKISALNKMYMSSHSKSLAEFEPSPTQNMIEIPVKVHVIKGANSNSKVNIKSLHEAFDKLNQYFTPNYTRFVLLGDFNFIYDEQFYSFDKSLENKLCNKNDVKNVVNLYIVGEIVELETKYCGYTQLPIDSKSQKNRVFLASSCLNNGVSLSRQMGHYLSLYPTHGSPSDSESEFVNGKNCATAGDEICDTPADPQLNLKSVDDRCGYIGKAQDKSGRKRYYKPNTHNLMSDNPRLYCCNSFTKEQYKRMLYAAIHIRNYLKFPSRGYSKRQLKQMTNDKGVEAKIKIIADNRSMRTKLTGNLYQNTFNLYPVGTKLKIQISNKKNIYTYVLEGNSKRKIRLLYPTHNNNPSTNKNKEEITIKTYRDKPLLVENEVGEDKLNHIAVLVSRKKLQLTELLQQINEIEGDLNVIQRVYKLLGPNIIAIQHLDYSDEYIGTKGVAIDKYIAPIFIGYQQQ